MKRLLCIIASMDVGGAETFLMKFFRLLDKEKYIMDFAVCKAGNGFYDKEIVSLGGRIHHLTPKSRNPIRNFFEIYSLVKKEKYKYVLRSGENAANALDLLAAKFGGAKVLGMRSTNSRTAGDTFKQNFVHSLFKPLMKITANVKISNSSAGAQFMFGKKCLQTGSAKIFKNSLDLSLYSFSNEKRNKLRRKLGFGDDDIVVGHIGRFSSQKNHLYLIKVFRKLVETNARYKLVLVGDGPLMSKIKEQVNKDDLLNCSVVFLGIRSDVQDLLSAMDYFAFPSLYEGLPNAVVEAQAAGLPCIVSNTISPEVCVTNFIWQLPINIEPDLWASFINGTPKERNQHAYEDLTKAGYNIKSSIELFNYLFFPDL